MLGQAWAAAQGRMQPRSGADLPGPALSPFPLQCPDKHQRYVAHVLGVPMHKVVVRTKRLGELASHRIVLLF